MLNIGAFELSCGTLAPTGEASYETLVCDFWECLAPPLFTLDFEAVPLPLFEGGVNGIVLSRESIDGSADLGDGFFLKAILTSSKAL
jgi:hypothetical protein